MLSPVTLVKRIWDATRAGFAVLFGTRTLRSIEPTLRVKHNAEVSATLIELASTIEKLNTWAARVAQRDAREAKRLLAEGEESPPAAPGPSSIKERKQMLRAARRAQRLGGQLPLPTIPPVAVSQPEMDGDDESRD
jgi:hypothetical protein